MKAIKFLLLLLPFVSLGQIHGCVPIRGNYLWMSETEVSNRYYHEFLSSISEEDSLKNLPDSEMWSKRFRPKMPMETYYFHHPAYTDYPLVNITHEQATEYCKWITKMINQNFPKQKVTVRLPSEKEWEFGAKAGNQFAVYPWGTDYMRFKKGKYQGRMRANFVRGRGDFLGVSGRLNDNADLTAPVMSYWPNDFGLYNMSGNVSEMVAEKGLVKGGSWRNRADYLRIDKQQYVYSASPEVGFRYVVEVVELPQPKKKPKLLTLNKKFFQQYFAEINDTLSIGKYEVTNELYKLYKKDFIKNKAIYTESIKDSLWFDLFPYSQFWMTNYSSHSNYNNYPAVNIQSCETEQFCFWLEINYERVFNEKIKIRLPSEQEWELAARGGLKNSTYPWAGPYARNSNGSFLANHNPKMSESQNVNGYDTLSLNSFFQNHFTDLEDFDGEAVLAPVDSYHPNGYGLYNMAGNAAEMVLDSNFTKGGSWKSKSYFLQIDSKEDWVKEANPFTGFRVVMIRKEN